MTPFQKSPTNPPTIMLWHRLDPRGSSRRRTIAVAGLLGITFVAAACGGSKGSDISFASTTTSVSTTTTSSSTTTTTVDPGTLPQTDALPSGTGAAFTERMDALAEAIIANDPSLGMTSFFPVTAYEQTKKNTDPAADWRNRLIANFDVDVATAHAKLGANASSAVFEGVEVPNTAVWVKPGEEYNVGPYWRVFRAQMIFDVAGSTIRIPIESMISWRGEWYVVHLGTIR